MEQLREIVRRAIEEGRIGGLDSAIDAAKEFGHDGLVPALTILRDWPRAGAQTRHTREDRRMNGKIKRLVRDRGFGFIQPDGGGEDIFFHRTACGRGVNFDTLKENDRVSFEAGNGPKGPRAEEVELA
jgi:CspA family cold shock protein